MTIRLADSIIKELDNHLIDIGDEVSASRIKHLLKMESKQFSNVMKEVPFSQAVKNSGYELYIPIGQTNARGKLLKIGKKFFRKTA